MECPYCGEVREEMTDEHVIPRGLGGNLRPTNPFLIRACKRCNNACGAFIDGPFVKSWFLQNARALGNRYYEAGTVPVAHLVYMGPMKGWPYRDTTCDCWLGPTGDHIYHVHKPYPVDHAIFAGVPPHLKKTAVDPGTVFIKLVGTNSDWWPIVLRSAKDAFPGATIRFLTLNIKTKPEPAPMTAADSAVYEWLRALPDDQQREFAVAVDMNLGERFRAKLALGFGACFLDSSFVTSATAAHIRNALWSRDCSVELPGASIFDEGLKNFAKTLSWKNCHVVAAVTKGDALALVCNFYSSHAILVQVTSDPSQWRGRVGEITLWVIEPDLRHFVGPVDVGALFLEKHNLPGPLSALQALIDSATPFPPFHAPAPPPA